LKESKNITLLLIPYLTICGTLYHVAYWDTFNLNGLLYISASDIIKSATQPVIIVFLSSIVTLIFAHYILRIDVVFPQGAGKSTSFGKKVNSDIGIFISLLIWATVVILLYYNSNPYRWTHWVYITAAPFWIFLFNRQFLINEISDSKIRMLTIQCLIYLPLFSFATGKHDSELIYKNLKYKYVKSISTNVTTITKTDTLKFIGASSQTLFLTDLKNETIFIINNQIDTLILVDNK